MKIENGGEVLKAFCAAPELDDAPRVGKRETVLTIDMDLSGRQVDTLVLNGRRYVPAPEPDWIDWSHVAPEWKWMARDADGDVWLFQDPPEINSSMWTVANEGEECIAMAGFASYRRGTADWRDSLVQRHEGA